jgi:hypothetical protein
MRWIPWTASLIIAAHAGAAGAEDLLTRPPEPRTGPPVVILRAMKLRDLAPREEAPELAPSRIWWFDHVELSKGGLKYQNSLELGDRRYRFSLRGPIQKERRLGLTFELRF